MAEGLPVATGGSRRCDRMSAPQWVPDARGWRVYRLTPTGTVMYGGVDTLRNVARARCIASASPDSAGIHRNPESIVLWANLAQNG